jgi:hypothetical protein
LLLPVATRRQKRTEAGIVILFPFREAIPTVASRLSSFPSGGMDQILGKVGGYWFNQRAGKEMSGVGDDINVIKHLLFPLSY